MIENILNEMKKWERLGKKESEDGSVLYGHTPRDYPLAYLHSHFHPLSNVNWEKYEMEIPESLSELYKECNGMIIFGSSIALYGIRTNFKRNLSSKFQPFDLKQHDREHRNRWHKLNHNEDNRIFFGSYGSDGSGIYITKDAEIVYRVKRNEIAPVNQWENIQVFIESEYNRIEKLFTKDGYKKDGVKSTVPTA